MKKFLITTTLVLSLSCMTLMGCGQEEAAEDATKTEADSQAAFDPQALMTSLHDDVKYDEELTELTAEDVANYMEVVEGTEVLMYKGGNSTGEEVAVFTCASTEDAATMKENVQTFLDDQISALKDYQPDAADRVKNAILVQKDNYLVLCVSGDQDQAQEIIDQAF